MRKQTDDFLSSKAFKKLTIKYWREDMKFYKSSWRRIRAENVVKRLKQSK